MKAAHLITGEKGEERAACFLESKGYLIIQRNWRVGRSEVDLIAGKENEVVFVEVKTRKNLDHGTPELFVSAAKQKKMCEAANSFINSFGEGYSIRFDIIAILNEGAEQGILHIENAFQEKTQLWR